MFYSAQGGIGASLCPPFSLQLRLLDVSSQIYVLHIATWICNKAHEYSNIKQHWFII